MSSAHFLSCNRAGMWSWLSWACVLLCCFPTKGDVEPFPGASTVQDVKGVTFPIPFCSNRQVVRFQSLYAASALSQAGMPAGYIIKSVALKLAYRSQQGYDTPILNNIRLAYKWVSSSSTTSALTVWGTGTFTFAEQVRRAC